MSARSKVKEMIGKRVRKNQAFKFKAAQRLGPNGIVLQFIEGMEKVQSEAKGPLEFEIGMRSQANLLYRRMRAVDPDVDIEIKWNNEDKTENWQDLQIEGVLIKWGKWYRGKHPFNDPEKYIDVASLFLEGHISEDEPVQE